MFVSKSERLGATSSPGGCRARVRLVTSLLGPQGGRLHASDTALRDIRLIYPNPATTLLRQLYVVDHQNVFDPKLRGDSVDKEIESG